MPRSRERDGPGRGGRGSGEGAPVGWVPGVPSATLRMPNARDARLGPIVPIGPSPSGRSSRAARGGSEQPEHGGAHVNVLIAYGSHLGSTAGIAEDIGDTIRRQTGALVRVQ